MKIEDGTAFCMALSIALGARGSAPTRSPRFLAGGLGALQTAWIGKSIMLAGDDGGDGRRIAGNTSSTAANEGLA